MNYERDYPVVATREDFIGKTFTEAKKLADEKGIRYDIDNGIAKLAGIDY